MTLPATTRRAGPYLGDSANTTFPFTFKVFAESDVAATYTDALGIDTELTFNSHYSVTLNADQEASPGGFVTYPLFGAMLPSNATLALRGNLPYDQITDLPTGGAYRAETIENQFDRTTMQIQQLDERLDRTLVLSEGADGVSLVLPEPVAGWLLGWNSDGTALENVNPDSLVGEA